MDYLATGKIKQTCFAWHCSQGSVTVKHDLLEVQNNKDFMDSQHCCRKYIPLMHTQTFDQVTPDSPIPLASQHTDMSQ